MMHFGSWQQHATTNFLGHACLGVSHVFSATVTNATVALKIMNGTPRCAPPSDDVFPTSRTWILHAR
jgi:hypothetical protein